MREKGKLRFVGYYVSGTGRPKDVYCNGWYPGKIEHEVLLTKFLLKLGDVRMERGYDVDPKIRCDATLWFPDTSLWHTEFDTGKQTFAQVEKRWLDAYGPIAQLWEEYRDGPPPPFVLIVTRRLKPKPKQSDGLLERMKPYRKFMYLGRYQELLTGPYRTPLLGAEGQQVWLPSTNA